MDSDPTSWKAIALASLTVSTGLLGVVVALVHKVRKGANGLLTNGNAELLKRIDRIETQLNKNRDEIAKVTAEVAEVRGHLHNHNQVGR